MQNLSQIIEQYKADTESVNNTWSVANDERLKAFRTIRLGVLQVIDGIKTKTFATDFKGSSLEFRIALQSANSVQTIPSWEKLLNRLKII
jgi:type II restriction enzyme